MNLPAVCDVVMIYFIKINDMTIPILQAVLVIVTLGVMILVLLGIHHLFSDNFETSASEIEDLRQDVNESDEVITDRSVFSNLVEVRESSVPDRQDPKM